ncbi:hypothetical protein WJX72_011641 [[Myrmecia] bisecta]|uniref:Rad50/SbcC-type AAA domain-containing protein n=1 Tax=[Myrmecia] bisecta TaxID=41462 RepID=A0AAW1R9D7_9CHLO
MSWDGHRPSAARQEDGWVVVLRKVKAEAAARNSGILFLGDFWHVRGSLPVEPLNSVLREFKDWTQPTLMLVGNHDQVNVGGTSHALTPLAAACPAVHILEEPTLFLDALWLPYRRDKADLEAAVAAAGPVKAVFAHADVLGAMMNETFQARHGISPDLFPTDARTYTGHYHKPHTVAGTTIQYVGSPYQVSRSEAGQEKALLLLNREWQVVERISLDVGPRHYNLSTQAATLPAGVRPGDRVKYVFESEESAETAQEVVQQLETQGVEVEQVMPPPQAAVRIADAEDLGALPLFHQYAEVNNLSPQAVECGVGILTGLPSNTSRLRKTPALVSFERLTLEGFGPFRDSVEYELAGRGVRAVTGRNEDDLGADSNGAGKSALMMAPLWAITGRSDARAEGGGGRGLTVADIVNDGAKVARVTVEGNVNGAPFTLERATSRKKLMALKFEVAGEDLTKADARLTQAEIERVLAADLLTRVVFHGQADATSLLEANDRDFKQELGKIVEMEVWDAAKDGSAALVKAARAAKLGVDREADIRRDNVASLQEQAEEVAATAEWWEDERQISQAAMRGSIADCAHMERVQQLSALLRDQQVEAGSLAGALQMSRQQLEDYSSLKHSSHVVETSTSLEAQPVCDRCLQPIDEAMFQANITRLQAEVGREEQRAASAQQAIAASQALLHEAEASLQQEWDAIAERQWEAHQAELRRLAAEEAALGKSHERMAAQQAQQAAAMAREREALARERQQAWLRRQAEEALARERAAKQATVSQAQHAVAGVQRTAARLAELLESLGFTSADAQHAVGGAALEDSVVPELIQRTLEAAESANTGAGEHAVLRQQAEQLSLQPNPHAAEKSRLDRQVVEERARLQKAEAVSAGLAEEVGWLVELDNAFGRSGIQSFALEGVLGELQVRTAGYLEQLSSGYTLSLSATRPSASVPNSAIEKINKVVHVRMADASVRERSLRQLSGGERRRVALALALGFAELIGTRGRLRSNLIVLDEVLQQLDGEGCARVASVLHKMPQDSVLVVGQAQSYVTQIFDAVDTVVKQNGCSHVESSL